MPGADGWLVAIGGNALAPGRGDAGPDEQQAAAEPALAVVVALAAGGGPLVVTHGNGPQVGQILRRQQAARDSVYALPLDGCVAQSQGEMGYLLAAVLDRLLAAAGIARRAVAVLTRVAVDPADPAMDRPAKPIGPWLPDPPAGPAMHDPARGHRRLVPSPRPTAVLEIEAVRSLARNGDVVIAGGGGGIPVRADAPDRGVEAVVDKDYTSALIGGALGLHGWLNLTDVPCAELDHRSDAAAPLGALTPATARTHLAAGHFAAGSMGPKIESAIRFCEGGGREAIITDAAHAAAALQGNAGTRIRSTP